jgi:dihydrofolate reductase
MSQVIVNSFSISVDGFGAGPDQDLANPLGVGGMRLHEWAFATRTFNDTHGEGQGDAGTIDDGYAARGMRDIGAWILGRNMFGPVRGPWPDQSWRGWWGDDPPYHCPVFVLTHFPREPIEMAGGTTFHFVTAGSQAALDLARSAAGERDIRVGGGVATLREYLRAGSIDEMHLAVAPVLLGRGESLWNGLDLPALGYGADSSEKGERATHLMIRKR